LDQIVLKPMKLTFALLPAAVLMVTGVATAQDALRYSWAADATSEAQRQAQAPEQPPQLYTYKAGDFRLQVIPSVEGDWNDNVNLSKTNAESDFIVQPNLQLKGSYPLTERNLLSLTVGVGYADYLQHSVYNHLNVASYSQLSFDMYIKDFWINIHDRFAMTDQSSTEAAVADTAFYGSFINTAGLSTTWELKNVALTVGYDHLNSLSTFGQFNYLDRYSELPLARAGFHFTPDLSAGVEGAATFTTYDYAVLNDNQSYSGGAYADWKPSPYLHVQLRGGDVIYQFQHTSQSAEVFEVSSAGVPISAPAGETIQTQDLNTWYADLTLSYKAAEAVTYAISGGHEMRLGILSDAIEDWYLRPNVDFMIVKDLHLHAYLSYEHGSEGEGNVTGNVTETYNWVNGGFEASYPLMKRLLLSLVYRLAYRTSNVASTEYTQNQVGLRLTYQLP
jgi:hypothetical protein